MVERRRRSLSSGTKIGKYELREAIRRQPERSLFNAYDPFLDRTVAIKIIQIFTPNSIEQHEAIDTFFTEARAIARLQHQNIVSVYDAGMGDYEGFMVMEFVHGQSLLQRLKRQNRLPVNEALQIVIQVCHALRYAHGKNIVHRDIKPSNIMLTNEGQVKLVDFGISFVASDDENNVPGLVGTPSYMAPELLDAKSPSEQSDQFSLGVVLYEMVTGRLPFAGSDAHGVLYKIINEEPAALEQGSASLSQLIFKMLAKDPNERFESTQVLEQELQVLADAAQMVGDYAEGVDTLHLKQANVFTDCDLETLQELALCSQIVADDQIEVVNNESVFRENDYYYVIEGQFQCLSAGTEIIANPGEWLTDISIRFDASRLDGAATGSLRLLHISSDKLHSSSMSTQVYFYRSITNRLIEKLH